MLQVSQARAAAAGVGSDRVEGGVKRDHAAAPCERAERKLEGHERLVRRIVLPAGAAQAP
jgi:hypothetical protein